MSVRWIPPQGALDEFDAARLSDTHIGPYKLARLMSQDWTYDDDMPSLYTIRRACERRWAEEKNPKAPKNAPLVRSLEEADAREKARQDYDQHDDGAAPPGYSIRGVSTLRNMKTGEPILRWEKDSRDAEDRIQQVVDALATANTRIPPRPRIKKPKAKLPEHLMNVVPIGDPHFGMYAWAPEAGADYDLDEAVRLHTSAFDNLLGRAPAASRLLFIDTGDLHHANDSKSRTPKSGHVLDVDGRWPKVMQATVDWAIWGIERGLETHEKVEWRSNRGNHNPEAAVGFAIALACAFRNNPRVKVHVPYEAYWYTMHGRVMIGTTHGDTCKPKDFGPMAATDWPEDWGHALVRHAYMGHVHHRSICKEHPGITVETLRTIAPKDGHAAAWARYRSEQDMRLHTWDARGEQDSEIIINVRSLTK